MTIEAGTVVMLKSGGQPMTVVSVDGDNTECIWCGEEGDFFRETIPALALQIALPADHDDEDEDNEEDEADAEENETEKSEAETAEKRTAA